MSSQCRVKTAFHVGSVFQKRVLAVQDMSFGLTACPDCGSTEIVLCGSVQQSFVEHLRDDKSLHYQACSTTKNVERIYCFFCQTEFILQFKRLPVSRGKNVLVMSPGSVM